MSTDNIALIDVDGHKYPNLPLMKLSAYDKECTKSSDPVRYLQRWVNNRKIFKTIKRFEDYDPKYG